MSKVSVTLECACGTDTLKEVSGKLDAVLKKLDDMGAARDNALIELLESQFRPQIEALKGLSNSPVPVPVPAPA